MSHASNQDQSGSGNQEMFSQGKCLSHLVSSVHHSCRGPFAAASFLKGKESNMSGDIDENQLMQNHEKVNNSNETVDSSEIGNAAALSAIKNVLGGSGGNAGGNQGFQQKLIGAAMAQAGQLFDQKSNAGAAQGDKQDAMQSAGQAVMKLMLKHQVTSMVGGGGSSGLSSLMSLAM